RIMDENFKEMDYNEFKYKSIEYEDLGHDGVVYPSFEDGLSWIYLETDDEINVLFIGGLGLFFVTSVVAISMLRKRKQK
ncbi:MAG: hypothetical protein ACXAD7_07745, partial [Candidatus Kariarchaeaceae archaeon]